jgi:hypothetical protein
MKNHPLSSVIKVLCVAAFIAATANALSKTAADASDFSGEYAVNNQAAHTFFHLGIEQNGATLQFAFDAGRDNGQGAAPEGTGTGRIAGAKANIKFQDSFGNSGIGTLTRSADGMALSLNATRIADRRAAEFYAKPLQLKQTSKRAQLQR